MRTKHVLVIFQKKLEEYEVQNAIDELVLKMMKKYNRGNEAYIYNTVAFPLSF